MNDDVALEILEQLKTLTDRVSQLENGRQRQRTGEQSSQFCRWTRKGRDQAFYVSACGPRIATGFDHERVLASGLKDAEACAFVMEIADRAIQFAIDATKGVAT